MMNTEANQEGLSYSVDEMPPLWLAIVLGFQHIIVIYGEIVLFPFVVGHLAGANSEHIRFACFTAAFAAAFGTILQVIRIGRFGSGYTLFMGSSAAYLACSVEAVKLGGFPLLATLSIIVAPLEALFSYFLRFLRHIITPAVGGVVLLLIVISLLPVSVKEWVGKPGTPHYASMENLAAGLITLITLLGIALFGGKRLEVWCPIIGIATGFLASWHLGLLHYKQFYTEPWLGIPSLNWWPGLTLDINVSHLSILAAMAVVTIINGVQAIGNSMAVQQVSERNFRKVDYARIQGCMYADSAGNVISGLLGTVPNEINPENISILGITGVASRYVGLFGALIMALLAFSPKISLLLIEMPHPVFGGFLMGLAAMMFPSGLSLLSSQTMNHQTGLLVGISLCIGMVAESGAFFSQTLPVALKIFTNSAVAAGGIAAVLLSVLFYLFPKRILSFQIDASIERLTDLTEAVENFAKELKADSYSIHKLQLACEEVFIHIAEYAESINVQEMLSFNIKQEDNGLFVEVICSRKISDVDHNPNEGLSISPDMDISGIRLSILNKITTDLQHLYISGNTYISFRIL